MRVPQVGPAGPGAAPTQQGGREGLKDSGWDRCHQWGRQHTGQEGIHDVRAAWTRASVRDPFSR